MIDRLFAPNTPEAIAHSHLTHENWFLWDPSHPSLNETLIAGCATYQAFTRYLSGADIFIYPRNRVELESILRRYVYDAVHNAISRSRSTPIERGGYSRICHLSEEKISNVLNNAEHCEELLAMHKRPITNVDVHGDIEHPGTPHIKSR